MSETTEDPEKTETANEGQTGDKSKLTLEEAEKQLEETRAALKKANREAAERRKKLDEIEQAEEDRKNAEMSDLEKAKADLEKMTPELEKLRKENQALVLRGTFEKTARELKLEFANETAQDDAFRMLDAEILGEDGAGIKDALSELQKSRPYLFSKVTPPETDAQRKGKNVGELTVTETLEKKRSAYGSL